MFESTIILNVQVKTKTVVINNVHENDMYDMIMIYKILMMSPLSQLVTSSSWYDDNVDVLLYVKYYVFMHSSLQYKFMTYNIVWQ